MSELRRAVVFVHGAGGGGWEWGVWARVFAAHGYAVSAPDLQAAPGGLAATTLADHAAQVAGWLEAARCRGPDALVLVGASLGGLLALMQARAADALVLVNPLPPAGLPADGPIPDIEPWGLRASLAGTRRAMPDADEGAALFAWRRWRDESGRVLREARAGVALGPVGCPVAVFASASDDEVPPAFTEALATKLNAQLWRLPGSHVSPLLGRQAGSAAVQAVEWLNTLALPV